MRSVNEIKDHIKRVVLCKETQQACNSLGIRKEVFGVNLPELVMVDGTIDSEGKSDLFSKKTDIVEGGYKCTICLGDLTSDEKAVVLSPEDIMNVTIVEQLDNMYQFRVTAADGNVQNFVVPTIKNKLYCRHVLNSNIVIVHDTNGNIIVADTTTFELSMIVDTTSADNFELVPMQSNSYFEFLHDYCKRRYKSKVNVSFSGVNPDFVRRTVDTVQSMSADGRKVHVRKDVIGYLFCYADTGADMLALGLDEVEDARKQHWGSHHE